MLAFATTGPLAARQAEPVDKLRIQLTSPLGRTGMTGAVRIVARVIAETKTPLGPVKFVVDGVVVGEDTDGPPYAVEWTDANPFEKREITAEVTDQAGRVARDHIELRPLEVYDTTEVSSVLLEPSVLDDRSHPVNGLKIGDFHVTENGDPQKIDLVVPDTIPAVYTLLVDSSQSMSRRIDLVREAARQLPYRLRPNDSVAVVPFSKTLGAVTGPTKDRDTIAGAIGAIHASGGTAILDCLRQAAAQIRGADERQIIVLITDGYDENSVATFEQTLDTLRAAKATVYVMAIGGVAGISLRGEDVLKRLASETGGRAFFPARELQISDMHQVIADDVQQRYVVTYTPTNQKIDGTWREIKLTTTTPGYSIRVRAGYYAPKPPPIRPQIELTVRDLRREFIDVMPSDFTVLEDGVEQKIEAFEEALTPVSIVMVIDSSGSMRKDAAAVKDAARAFVKALPAKDRLAVITFADKPELAHDLSTDRSLSLGAIDRYQANGGTALYDAVLDAVTRLKRAEGRTAIVVLTDGRDENNPGTAPGSTHTLDQMITGVKGLGATVYAIGLGTGADHEPLEKLAAASSGETYFPEDVSRLAGDYRRVIENLRRRYVLSYTSTNVERDGAWRRVEIRPVRAGMTVETRGGYFAPEGSEGH